MKKYQKYNYHLIKEDNNYKLVLEDNNYKLYKKDKVIKDLLACS